MKESKIEYMEHIMLEQTKKINCSRNFLVVPVIEPGSPDL
jgi:hypothetical protein